MVETFLSLILVTATSNHYNQDLLPLLPVASVVAVDKWRKTTSNVFVKRKLTRKKIMPKISMENSLWSMMMIINCEMILILYSSIF